jgi:V/A-type H+-transporting ATPase subunit D
MERAPATRTELLARRRQLALARQGRDLLEEKRTALVRELMKMVDVVVQEGSALDRAVAAALDALALARAFDGPAAVHSAALAAGATGQRLEVVVEGTTVMGVAVPIITPVERRRALLDRGYSLAFSSARIDQVAETFEEELRCLVRVAEADSRIRRLGGEIQRTARRVNALRHAIIPALEQDVRRMAAVLQEQEREEHYRLKHLKRRRFPVAGAGR